jgi:SNF family Na+-dependent transporter
MIPYFFPLLVLGIPICLVEWTIGRHGGRHGFNSAPGVFRVVWPSRASTAFGALAVFVPVIIYMYYVFIEAWCLGYAWFYLTGGIDPGTDPSGYPTYFSGFFNDFIGVAADGALFRGLTPALVSVAICFALNFWLIYRGLSGGIEKFCQWAMPALVIAALIVLARVLTLGLGGPLMAPQAGLVDPALTVTLPPRLTAYTGRDALTHAGEAYTTPVAGPVSDTAHCLERSELQDGTVYSECRELPAAQAKL